ncbi:hypothetical protein GS429_07165 [Natronorubrum sp. JWXQ-INN-674]|uniref:Uncharacterized protein n=2 Tax=Natronorubrum halalkaliphilum TaxID=2691917 RepID=A0A6B0VK01_9EURY|nr:hypothetical protein [Natronorubrum halalkaliphilum]
MSRHLRACLPDSSERTSAFHLRITGAQRSDYWLHLLVEAETTLSRLDAFLREFWLECCGHMSAFTTETARYEKPYDDQAPAYGPDRQSMDVPIRAVDDEAFTYEYDFGSTTTLDVAVVDTGDWSLADLESRRADALETDTDGIGLLARNDPPEIDCGTCGESATKVCQTCLWQYGPDAWLCEPCATDHEADCERPNYLPKVNSPRTGVCGYRG